MAEVWNTYIGREPFTVSFDGQGDGVYILRLVEDEPPPSELAVATGEWLYNVRSALDYVIWATTAHVTGQLPPPDEGQLQYPIYDSEDAWTRNLYRLKHLEEHHRSMLKTMQPFNSDLDANYLGWINRLARIDRHRHLNHMTAYLAVIEPVIAVPEGCSTTLQWGERVLSGGRADVARIVVSPWRAGMEVHVNPRFGVDPEIAAWAESPFWKRVRFSERFRILQVFVAAEIAVYEYDCIGSSRGADALMEEYRAECDARRSESRKYPTRERAPVTWTEAKPGKRTTGERFNGVDFPTSVAGDAEKPGTPSA